MCAQSRLRGIIAKDVGSSGMIPASAAEGSGLDRRYSPVFLVSKHGNLAIVEGAWAVVVTNIAISTDHIDSALRGQLSRTIHAMNPVSCHFVLSSFIMELSTLAGFFNCVRLR